MHFFSAWRWYFTSFYHSSRNAIFTVQIQFTVTKFKPVISESQKLHRSKSQKGCWKKFTPFQSSYNQMQDYLLKDQKVTVHRDGTFADVDKLTKMEKKCTE